MSEQNLKKMFTRKRKYITNGTNCSNCTKCRNESVSTKRLTKNRGPVDLPKSGIVEPIEIYHYVRRTGVFSREQSKETKAK